MPLENQFFLNERAMGLKSVSGFVGWQVPRLYGGTIFEWGGVTHLGGPAVHRTQNVRFPHICNSLEGTWH